MPNLLFYIPTYYIPTIVKLFISVDDCKRRWKNIKDTHNRNKRKLGTGSASSSKKKWILADRVSFLNSVDNERR